MSELMSVRSTDRDFRRRLLATVSVLTLLGTLYGAADAEQADSPTVWIELGGQLERIDGGEERFAPAFVLVTPRPDFQTVTATTVERPPRYSNGAEGKISFEPASSNWVISAFTRYGRSNGDKHEHQQTYPKSFYDPAPLLGAVARPNSAKFSDFTTKSSESHFLLDFQAGKDVGLGMFGNVASSVLSVGVRFAQFTTRTSSVLKSDPDWHFHYKYHSGYSKPVAFGSIYHSNAARANATRSFHGIGPSISWNASAPVLGNAGSGEASLDWGVNAALLFGRQKAIAHHQTTAYYHGPKYPIAGPGHHVTLYQHLADHIRARSVTVPNIGGFAGVSFRYSSAKLSLGYRADFFLGVMDDGIDTRIVGNRDFYGPFATISAEL